MVLPQAMAWVQYWFCVLSLKFCGKSKKFVEIKSPETLLFWMYGSAVRRLFSTQNLNWTDNSNQAEWVLLHAQRYVEIPDKGRVLSSFWIFSLCRPSVEIHEAVSCLCWAICHVVQVLVAWQKSRFFSMRKKLLLANSVFVYVSSLLIPIFDFILGGGKTKHALSPFLFYASGEILTCSLCEASQEHRLPTYVQFPPCSVPFLYYCIKGLCKLSLFPAPLTSRPCRRWDYVIFAN